MNDLTPARLRELKRESTARPFDLAIQLGIPEAALIEAELGGSVTRIDPTLARLFPAIQRLGEVMALTRNRSCVIEKVGVYNKFHDGKDAALTLDEEIDMRMFPSHWVHAYAVEVKNDETIRRSIQVFDSAGDAVHKVHLRENSDLEAWAALVDQLALPDQTSQSQYTPRAMPVGAVLAKENAADLRAGWGKMTDAHQFTPMVERLKMNRLGAYRIAGSPYARPLAVGAVPLMLEKIQAAGIGIMFFVGNMGCIEIHSGPMNILKPMGPWLNVLDERFNLHLRSDHVAEVWLVDKPTRRGGAISVEAFDAAGELIFQCFGMREDRGGDAGAWKNLVESLPAKGDA